jgi:hypothetical protein
VLEGHRVPDERRVLEGRHVLEGRRALEGHRVLERHSVLLQVFGRIGSPRDHLARLVRRHIGG